MKSSTAHGLSDLQTHGEVELSGKANTPVEKEFTAASNLQSSSSGAVEGDHVSDQDVDEHEKTVISRRPVAAPAEFFQSIPLAELAKLLEGRQLDHFSVEQMIGGGGMGAVFRGKDLRLDRIVAIKVIPASKGDVDTLRRFRMEAQSAARLDHPNIARVYYIGEAEDWNYIVFEFIDGVNLRDLVDMEGPLSIDDAVYYTRQVAEALQHAADRNVVHRDIKPSNILITPAGVAKVVDMGLARSTALDRSTADLTASGVTLGTFDYISPEQAKNPRDADVRSDLYSLGCALFFMLAGRPPFPEGTALQKLLNHGSQPPPDLRQLRDDLSDQLYAVLMKLMAKRPTERYQKPTELVNDLMLVAESEDLQRSRTPGTLLLTPNIAERSVWEANLPWLVAFALLLGSAFWLQSAQSLTNTFELPQPVYAALSTGGSSTYDNDPSAPASAETGTRLEAAPVELPQDRNESVQPSDDGQTPSGATMLPPSPTKQSQSGIAAAESNARESPLNLGPNAFDNRETLPPSLGGFIDSSSLKSATSDTVEIGEEPTSRYQPAPSQEEHLHSPTAIASGLLSDQLYADPSAAAPASQAAIASGSSQSNSPSPSPTSRSLDTIFVSTIESGDDSRQLRCSSLSEAFTRAATMPEIRSIELGSDIVVRNRLSIPRDGLTIRAAPNATVEIRFSPTPSYLPASNDSIIEIGNRTLRLEGISLSATFPSSEIVGRFAVFGLTPGGQLELSNCRFTVYGHSASGGVQCVTLRGNNRELPSGDDFGNFESFDTPLPKLQDSTVVPASVRLRGCVVRGQATFLGIAAAQRAEIAVEQSLLALSEKMIDTDLRLSGQASSPSVRLSLKNSTFACGSGFCRLGLGTGQLGSVCFNRTAQACVFWSPAAVPHIVLNGSRPTESLDEYILMKGEDNAYDQAITTICQFRVKDSGATDFGFSDGVGTWFREAGNENLVWWQNAMPPAKPFYDVVAEDFRIRFSMFMPGFEPPVVSSPILEY